MFRTTVLGLALALGFATAAGAAGAVSFTPSGNPADASIIKVGEGCGAGFWRGPGGHCNPFNGPNGNNRGTRIECPLGWHIDGRGERCFPNR